MLIQSPRRPSEVSVTVKDITNRFHAYAMIYQWCMENDIKAIHDSKQYHTASTVLGTSTTTFWSVPDEKQRTLFLLRWG